MSGSQRLYLPERPERNLVGLPQRVHELTLSRRSYQPEDNVYSRLDVTHSLVESSRLYLSETLDPTELPHSFHDLRVSCRNYQEHHAFLQSEIKEELFTLKKKLEKNQEEQTLAGTDSFTEEATAFTASTEQLDVPEEKIPEEEILLAEMNNLCKKIHQLMETVKTLTEEKNSLTAMVASLESEREEQLSVNQTLSAEVRCLHEVSNVNKKKIEEYNNLRTRVQVLQYQAEKAQNLICEKDVVITKQKSQIAFNQQMIEDQCAMINGLKQSVRNLEDKEVQTKHEKEIKTSTQSLRKESRAFAENKPALDIHDEQKAEELSKPTPVQYSDDTTPVNQPENKNLLAETGNQLKDEKVLASTENHREKSRTSNRQKLDIHKEHKAKGSSEQIALGYSGVTTSMAAFDIRNLLAETDNQLEDEQAPASTENTKEKAKTPNKNAHHLDTNEGQRAKDPCEITPMKHNYETTPATAPKSTISLADTINQSQKYEILVSTENFREHKRCTENTEEQDMHEKRPENILETPAAKLQQGVPKSILGWFSKGLLKFGVCVCISTFSVAVLSHTLSDCLNSYQCDSLWDFGHQPINPDCNNGNLGIHPF
ncbi:hypothetical protein Q8A73_004742 [Channa argus]|nr:hypothetical protein Q8A73_004742 [Channa argus]